MTQPASQTNATTQELDTLYGTDGTGRIKLGVGSKAVSGVTPTAAWHGVATHQDADTFGTNDGVVVLAGVDGTTIRKVRVDASGNLQSHVGPSTGSVTNRSGTIATGGTQQMLMDVNNSRQYMFLQNIDPTEDLWLNFTTNAVADEPSIRLSPGDSFVMEGTFVSTEKISVIAATTGHKFTAKEA